MLSFLTHFTIMVDEQIQQWFIWWRYKHMSVYTVHRHYTATWWTKL
jgi:hypothetical protein